MCLECESQQWMLGAGKVGTKQHKRRNDMIQPIFCLRLCADCRIPVSATAKILPTEAKEHAVNAIQVVRICMLLVKCDDYWHDVKRLICEYADNLVRLSSILAGEIVILLNFDCHGQLGSKGPREARSGATVIPSQSRHNSPLLSAAKSPSSAVWRRRTHA